ncbi:Uncharacterized protein TCAP_06098 [Tolypocladium capitatum]|uniref:C2H2-type domain-containing protein n=1 Tax=Tolypocladium capitatum TaxID=45235 RepID=A0A2K3Q8T0_9HYPO|nr:Uncharacterized protein TCAP_06098 [Tolypocladium capitatum]
MTHGSITCDVCSKEIVSMEDTLRHIKLHQSQMLSLINRLDLNQNVRVRDIALNECDDCDLDDSNASESFGNTHHVEHDANCTLSGLRKQSPNSVLARFQVRQTQGKNFKCPRQQCKRKRFRRKQELVRHFATHYKIRKVCPSCSTIFTEASKFKTHQCGASVEEQRIIRTQYDEMRQAIEMQLGLRNPNQSDNQITESNAPEQLTAKP